MYSTCLHCTKPLGTNDVLETLPIGRRIAFDAAKGRLWVVCRHCAKWNLVPFDTRLESIDACERIYRDTATRYSTGTIGLARTREGLDLVRIGEALRPEFAAWRYGESYRRRRRNALLAGGAMAAVAGVGVAVVGATAGLAGFIGYGGWQFVRGAWGYGSKRAAAFRIADPDMPGWVRRVHHVQLKSARFVWEEEAPRIEVFRLFGSPTVTGVPMAWRGEEAKAVGRRVVGGLNVMSGTKANIHMATDLLATHKGDLAPWFRLRATEGFVNAKTRETAPRKKPWGQWEPSAWLVPQELPNGHRLGLEMWLNEDIERIWLEGELRLLEREWRQAEELAKIADDLVVATGA